MLSPVLEHIRHSRLTMTKAPVEHPAFISFPSSDEHHGRTILSDIIAFLATEEDRLRISRPLRILDISEYQGYFARNMYRVTKSTSITCIDQDIELVSRLNNLLHIGQMLLYNDLRQIIQQSTPFDVVFLMNSLDNISTLNARRDILRTIASSNPRILFVDFDREEAEDYHNEIQKVVHLRTYHPIRRILRQGREREVGAFM